MTAIMIKPGAMNVMYGTPSIEPMRLPTRLPKMMKYSVIVIAGGTIVWIQMRTTRRDSLRTIVQKPTRLMRQRFGAARRALDGHLVHAERRSCLSTSRMNSSSSRLVLVRMLDTCSPAPTAARTLRSAPAPSRLRPRSRARCAAAPRSPASAGAAATGSCKLSTNTSSCSLPMTLAMLSFSMMRPSSMIAMLRQRLSASSR